jgi:NTE family protein
MNVAGASAGAIVSALIAAGYNSDELKDEINKLDYMKLKQPDFLTKLGTPGEVLDVIFHYGIYSAEYFENWLETLLKKKGKTRFRDIKTGFTENIFKYKFNAIASDLTDKKMLILPGDLSQFGFNPDEYSIAKAVRMSMSIPVFFKPFKLKDVDGREHIIVDGGLLSNYPIWLLDDNKKTPEWPTFGFKFDMDMRNDAVAMDESGQAKTEGATKQAGISNDNQQADVIKNIIGYMTSILQTMMDAHDKYHVSNTSGDYERTIFISNLIKNGKKRNYIGTTDFDITPEECNALYSNGFSSATRFLNSWNFGEWVAKHRS